MDDAVEHDGAPPMDDGSNGSFSNSILMVGSNARKLDGLSTGCNVSNKSIISKGFVVCMVGLDGVAMSGHETFIGMLGLQGLSCPQ